MKDLEDKPISEIAFWSILIGGFALLSLLVAVIVYYIFGVSFVSFFKQEAIVAALLAVSLTVANLIDGPVGQNFAREIIEARINKNNR